MMPNEQLILVCEKLLGWTYIDEPCGPTGWINKEMKPVELPPLTLDLWHECWLRLTPEQKETYIRNLGDIVCKYGLPHVVKVLDYTDFIKLEDATAEQRLVALVETIGENEVKRRKPFSVFAGETWKAYRPGEDEIFDKMWVSRRGRKR